MTQQQTTPISVMPHDPVAERTILGALSIGSVKTSEIFDRVKPEDFFLPQNRTIFQCMQRLWDQNHEVSSLTLYSSILADDPEMNERCGGTGYWSSLGDGMIRVDSSIGMLIDSLKNKRWLRQIASYADGVLQKSLIAGTDPQEMANKAVDFFLAISEDSLSDRDDARTDHTAANDLMNKVLPIRVKSKKVKSGIAQLDTITGGFLAGELIIITAETGVGKTFLALQIKRNACRAGLHGLYASGEMVAEHLMARHLTSVSGIAHWKMRQPESISPEEFEVLRALADEQCETCRILDGELSLPRIRTKARAIASRKELQWVMVDYDELVDVPQCKDEWEEQKIISRSLKSLGMQLGVPSILISQLRKPPDTKTEKPPSLSDLYGSGAKAKHASMVIYVQRKFVQKLAGDETDAKLWLLKCRDGRQGTVACTFNIKTLTFDQKPEEWETPKK
jgi:replicative DNA helicase